MATAGINRAATAAAAQGASMQAEVASSMRAADLERYLHDHIPLSRALAVRVEYLGPELVRLSAPLAPNLNHRRTAFGGSVASLAILAGWSWLLARFAGRCAVPRLVIQEETVEYLAPIDAAFEATCPSPVEPAWRRFVRALDTRGRGRLELAADVTSEGRLAARFCGLYVAIAVTGADER
jgi:thioesterase domain-containing protein